MAVGSFIEEYDNYVEIITRASWNQLLLASLVVSPCLLSGDDNPGQALQECLRTSCRDYAEELLTAEDHERFASCAVDDASCKFTSDGQLAFQHPYPPTKIMFMPDKEGAQPDLLATTGDYLRIWQLKESGTQLIKLLNNVGLSSCPVITAGLGLSCKDLRGCVDVLHNAILHAKSCVLIFLLQAHLGETMHLVRHSRSGPILKLTSTCTCAE